MDIQLNKAQYFSQENVKMSIILDKYCLKPEGFIEGSINITPKLKGEIKLKEPKIILTLTQYEFFDYINKEKDLSSKQKEHNKQHKEIIFKKEAKLEIENNKITCTLQIPIKVSIPKNDKLLPTFNLKNKDIIAGIRHIFTINFPEINSITSIGVIFSELNEKKENPQNNNNTLFINEQINKMGLINKVKISYCIRLAKNVYNYNEDINMKIMVDSSSLQETKIKNIKIKLQRKIIIFGYTVNSDFRYSLNEKIFEKNELNDLSKQNSNIYELEYTFPKLNENNFNEKEIEQYIHFNENIIDKNWDEKILAPTVKGYFFSCEYKIKIRTILDSSLITTKKIDCPIQIYFSDDYFNKFKLTFKHDEEEVKFGSFIIIQNKDKDNKKEEIDKNINNNNNIQLKDEIKEEKEKKEENENNKIEKKD